MFSSVFAIFVLTSADDFVIISPSKNEVARGEVDGKNQDTAP